jgi:carboxyl-terminal processing protease
MQHISRRCAFLALFLTGLFATEAVAQRPARKLADTGRIMRRVAGLLERAHLTRHDLDDEISHRALPKFLESLDPLKVYFRKSDVTAFEAAKDKLDDMLSKGDMTFAKVVFDRFLIRLAERVEWTREFADAGQDFTIDEEFVSDPDTIDYPKGGEVAKERWRKRVKYDLLRLKGDEIPDEEAKGQVKRRYKSFLRRMRQFDDEDILAVFITSISSGYDPHTSYMSRRTLEDFEIRMRLNYQGIGARLLDEDGYAVVTSIMPGGAAKKQGGLEPKDKILAVAQGDKEFVDIVGMRLNDAVQLIRGKEGTVVRLKIRRKGVKELVIVSLTRAKTELQDSKAIGKVFDAGKGEHKIKVGVIDLPSFYGNMGGGAGRYRSCSGDVRTLLSGFEKKKVDVVVLDLRFNGGGLLNEAVKLTGLFIDKGPVVQVKGFRGRVEVLDDELAGVSWNGPLIVLTSKFSASASEIVAGAIKDYGRGIIVGDESSHGKGTVQRVLDLGAYGPKREQLGALKLTVQQFFRPDGRSTQLFGVRADVQLPSFTNEIGKGEAELDHAVPFATVSPKKHDEHGMAGAKLVKEIRRRSVERLAKSEHFARLRRDIDRYNARKGKKTVTLNLEKFLALLASTESDKKKVEAHTKNEDEIVREIKLNDYLSEVLEIAVNYEELLKGHRLALRR